MAISNAERVDTIVPKNRVDLMALEDFHMYVDRIPIKNSKQREYIEYSNVVFAVSNRIPVNRDKIYKVGGYSAFYF